MNNRFQPPRGMYQGHYPTFPGNAPMPAPLAPPERIGAEGMVQRLSSSVRLSDGNPQNIIALQFPEPRSVHCMLSAPMSAQSAFVRTAGCILPRDPSGLEANDLWILGEALIGIGGTIIDVNFDIPLDQLVEFDVSCESLLVKTRLYKAMLSSDSNYSRATFENPPVFGSTTVGENGVASGAASLVTIYGNAGEGCGSGGGNLTRRMRTQSVNMGGTDVIYVPSNATSWKILATTGTTVDLSIRRLLGIPPYYTTDVLATLLADSPARPLPQGINTLTIHNNTGAGGFDAETIFGVQVNGLLPQ